MRKLDEIQNPASCLNRAKDDEVLFVLRGHDLAAPATIRAWCAERIALGKNNPLDWQLVEAEQAAQMMEQDQLRYDGPGTAPNQRRPQMAFLCEMAALHLRENSVVFFNANVIDSNLLAMLFTEAEDWPHVLLIPVKPEPWRSVQQEVWAGTYDIANTANKLHRWKTYPSTSFGGSDPTDAVIACQDCGEELTEENQNQRCVEELSPQARSDAASLEPHIWPTYGGIQRGPEPKTARESRSLDWHLRRPLRWIRKVMRAGRS